MIKNTSIFIWLLLALCFGQNEIIVGVSELEFKGDVSIADASLVSESIRSYVTDTKKYVLIDAKLMHDILNAQNISSCPSCSERPCLEDLGKLLSCSIMIGGKIERKGKSITLRLLAVDVQRNKIVSSVDSCIKTARKDFFDVSLPQLCASLLKPIGSGMELSAENLSAQNGKEIQEDTSKSSSVSIVKIGGISALVVGAAAAGGYYYLKSKHKKPTNTSTIDDVSLDDAPQHP